ncbi:putative inactive histone-lysine N-methyltransferase SUVR1 isoform X1 [Iris pallida]|uniref:Inactive histone-lysine N-methyltransferase SUVR1 isoform X1 n=1 Tax=Iris pallida TaxID=29817 RepID=A0AAX6H8D9_IRIPA|nr:putative inactive histone-lysine N-methyltransferase SUVR1 isoform X1 [Iris pallida]
METDDERAVDVDRRRSRRGNDDYPYFPDVFSPFNSNHSSLSQLLNLMDQFTGTNKLTLSLYLRSGLYISEVDDRSMKQGFWVLP